MECPKGDPYRNLISRSIYNMNYLCREPVVSVKFVLDSEINGPTYLLLSPFIDV